MKKPRNLLILTISILVTIVLSACSGTLVNSWPGASANDDVIYLSYQGAVYAINAQNGSQVWSFPAKPDAAKPFYAAPSFSPDGLVVVGNYGQMLYGINPTGTVAWEFEGRGGNFVASPLVTADLVLAPMSDGVLYALDLDGRKVWEFEAGSALWSKPASNGELVFVPSVDHELFALSLDDGQTAWTKDLDSALVSSPVMSEDGTRMFITTMEGQVIALDPINGSVVWETPTDGRIWSSPTLSDDVLYVGINSAADSKTGAILALSATDGSLLWQQPTASPVIGGAVVLPDSVIFPTEGGDLIAWDLNGQKQLWTQPVNGKLYATPVIAGDTLVVTVAEGDNLVQAFSLNGQMTWTFKLQK